MGRVFVVVPKTKIGRKKKKIQLINIKHLYNKKYIQEIYEAMTKID